jgi:endonuclease/exonuclease/phosphatase family metal-dependent hydrolase
MYAVPDLFQMGDGLNRFSRLAFLGHERETWAVCHGTTSSGSDCMTEKGFSAAATRLTDDLWLDVYNLHMDAGSGEDDLAARDAQVAQFLSFMRVRSAGRAVIVAGDTNMDRDDPEERVQLEALLTGGGFVDACEMLDCGEDHKDRVLYRSSTAVTLEPVAWFTPAEFVDGEGQDLSDHKPVAVHFVWRRVPRD